MEAGIVGLPNVGKSTLFNALTAAGIASENYPFCTIEPNVGVVAVPDARLAQIESHIPTEKVVPAILRLVDIAGIVKGASKGEGLGNKFLSHIRTVDAVVHVVRCFVDEDVTHVDGGVDPIRDIETIDTELMLADLQTVETALPKAQKLARSGDKEGKARLILLEQCQTRLAAGEAVRGLNSDKTGEPPTAAPLDLLKSFGLLTAKPVLYVANVDENDLHGESEYVQRVRNHANIAPGLPGESAHTAQNSTSTGLVVPVCAKLEAELAELNETDRAELLESVGLTEPALSTLARAAYQLLGQQSFFTAGPKEIKAWTIPIGATAPQAAGVIHSDFQRGFIRAEIYSVDDLNQYKTEKAIRDAGKLRIEGKTYLMRDGDVCHFLFNV